MPQIPDINQTERWILETTLRERYAETVPFEEAEAELRLLPSDRELSLCPVMFWTRDNCHFVVFKTGDSRYRCQFYYRLYQQYGTGVHEYDDFTECVVSLLQAQADHEAQERGDLPSKRRG